MAVPVPHSAYALAHGERVAETLGEDYQQAEERAEERRHEARERALERLGVWDATSCAMGVYGCEVSVERIPTGIRALDTALGGGLPEGGLTVVGAVSSGGKTTLVGQWADSISASGRDVLFCTIEQSRHELVAKSLSRDMRRMHYTASYGNILSAKERKQWPQAKTESLLGACERYSLNIAPHMHFMELAGQPTAKQITKAFELVRKRGKPAPVLCIDYLQLLAPPVVGMDTRRGVDENVRALRQLARDAHTAVVVISSINRGSYTEGADMSAFKESGGIEFSSDVALMLQPRGYSAAIDKADNDKVGRKIARKMMDKYKKETEKASELVILKNRAGEVAKKPIPLVFEAISSLFYVDPSASTCENG